ncbi:MAG: hypothetical protein K5669_07605 [Lachnospiraceae bacterium]|nr:hypothetical protein [Lachnospiraceae bacterium]
MRKLMSIIGAVFGAALVIGLLQIPIDANAATNFKLTWDTGTNDWYASSDGGATWYSKDYLTNNFKDGDVLIIDGQSASSGIVEVTLNGKIGELAVIGGAFANVTAPGATLAYASTGGNVLVLNSDLDTLNANYGATNQVNGNVKNVNCTYKEGSPIVVGITGTVGSANVLIAPDKWTQVMAFNFAAGKFAINEDNTLATDAQYYSLSAGTPAASGSGSTPALDDVPKTGRSYNGLILIAAALVIISGGAFMYAKSR